MILDDKTQPGSVDTDTRAIDFVRSLRPGMTISDAAVGELEGAQVRVPGLLARKHMYLEREVFGWRVRSVT